MIFSRTKVAISFLVAFFLQPIIGALFGLQHFGPNIILCLATFLLVIYYDSPFIWGSALLTSIAYDICYTSTVGFSLAGIVVCMLAVLIVRYFIYLDNIWIVPILTLIDTIIFNLIEYFIASQQGSIYSFGYMFKYMAGDLIGNAITLLVMFVIFRKYLVKHKNDAKLYT